MLICPNKNLKEWKDLAASVGENRAMLMWYESEGKVGFTLSAQTTILDNLSKVNSWFKQMKDTDTFWNKLQKDLQIPKDQINLLKESNGKTIEEKLISFVTDYSYTVEVNVAMLKNVQTNYGDAFLEPFEDEFGNTYALIDDTTDMIVKAFRSKEDADEYISKNTNIPSQHYSNLTVPGGTNYTENEISTPLITPSIKGHAQFSTDNGIGWFRSDEQSTGDKLDRFKVVKNGLEQISKNTRKEAEDFIELHSKNWKTDKSEYSIIEDKFDIRPYGSKTRRILEVQSDLFQKGRDKKDLIKGSKILNTLETETVTEEYEKDGFLYFINDGVYTKNDLSKEVKEEGKFTKITKEEYEKNIPQLETKEDIKQNQFLQLLNKDNNWVTFFVKSIIQSTAKQTVTEIQQEDVEAKVRELEKSGLLKINCP